MPQEAIFGPMLATIGLTFVVWVYMFARRITFINSGAVTPEELALPGKLAEVSPAEISNPSDNLKNLFEIPVLFYALALYLYATSQVDGADVIAGWVFAAGRVGQSVVHCTYNNVMHRFYCYFVSTLAVWFIAGRAAIGWLA